jgi:autotransporter-associated beta strand protein
VLGGTVQVGDGGTTGSIAGNVFVHTTFAINRSDTYSFGGTIVGDGAFVQMGSGTTILTNNNAYLGGTTIAAGTLQLGNGGASGSIIGNVVDNGTFAVNRSDTYTFGGAISGSGAFQQIGTGTTILTATNTYAGGTTITAGTLQLGNGGASGSIIGNVLDNGTFAINRSDTYTFGGVISGSGAFQQIGTGTTILTAVNAYSGGTAINGGVLAVAADANLGAASGGLAFDGGTLRFLSGFTTSRAVSLNAGGGTIDTNGNAVALAGVISGGGGLTKVGAGTLTLNGTSPYSGPPSVDAGTLVVNGSIANSAVTVNAGGRLEGTGTVGSTTIAGGATFAPGSGVPGSSMTVAGNLALQSGALYVVQVNPTTASFVTVTGTANLAGSLQLDVAPGKYVPRQYTILTSGGLTGSFSGVNFTNPNFSVNLSYTATDVILNFNGATLGAGAGLNQNQQNVANAISTFFNGGGDLPPAFASLFRLTGANLGNALSLLSGEPATGAQQAAFMMTNQLLTLMLDPFVDGRRGIAGGGPALGFAPERDQLPRDIALAFASLPGATATTVPSFGQRWSVWAAGYGGGNRTGGDPAVTGSHDLTARAGGVAAGIDYQFSPDAVFGFALAGGATNWTLAQGLGGGNSDAFQAGVYAAARSGPAYVAAALAFASQWMSTDRFAAFGDHLTARFNAQGVGARVESGYRLAMTASGITPYAALQAQGFHTPTYSETDLTAGGFGLTYNSRTAHDIRSELGARFDHVALVDLTGVLTLRSRLAWAHDWASDPSLAAAFQALPGPSFIVNGATPASNSLLASAGAELRLANGVTFLGRLDGELARHAQTYSGTGTVRWTW